MKCCNPECEAPFDYREGQLIRVSRPVTHGNGSARHKAVEHFWICGKCSGEFVLEQHGGMRVTLRSRESQPASTAQPEFVSAA